MTYIESVLSLIILSLFLAVFAQVAYPSLLSLKRANDVYISARNLQFIDASFRRACMVSGGDFDGWKRNALFDKNVTKCEIHEVYAKGSIKVYKARIEINGDVFEIYAENVK